MSDVRDVSLPFLGRLPSPLVLASTSVYRRELLARLDHPGIARLIEGGGVRVDSCVVSDKGLKLAAGIYVVQVGKRKFARVTLG